MLNGNLTAELLIDLVKRRRDSGDNISRITAQISEAIKREQELAEQNYWTNPLTGELGQTDAMASLSDELFNPRFHVDQFCQVAEFLVKCRLGIVFVNTVRESSLRIKELLTSFAREVEKSYSYDRLSALLTVALNDSPQMQAVHDLNVAKDALRRVLAHSPALLEEMIDQLATRHQPQRIRFSRNSHPHIAKQAAAAAC